MVEVVVSNQPRIATAATCNELLAGEKPRLSEPSDTLVEIITARIRGVVDASGGTMILFCPSAEIVTLPCEGAAYHNVML